MICDFQQRILDWAKAEGLDRPRPGSKNGSKLPPRKAPSMSDKLAAVLLLLRRPDGRPLIPEHVRALCSKEAILKHPLHWDHIIARGLCGTDTYDNYRPLDPVDHAPKTRADKKKMAHNARLQKKRLRDEHDFRERVLAPAVRENRTAQRLKSRPMAGSKASKYRKRMDGRVELR